MKFISDGADGGTISTLNVDYSGSKLLSVGMEVGEFPSFYLDGLFVGDGDKVCSVTSSAGTAYIWNRYTFAQAPEDAVAAALIFNRKLTATEHSILHGELMKDGI